MTLLSTWMIAIALTVTPALAGDGSEADFALTEATPSACDELAELAGYEAPSKLGYDEEALDELTFDCLVSLADDYGCDTVYVSDSEISDAVAETPLWEKLGQAIARGELAARPGIGTQWGWLELSPENKREFTDYLRRLMGSGWWYVGVPEITLDDPDADKRYDGDTPENDPDELGDGECIP